MSLRPLVFVSGLTFGDYMLWNWSLNGNHDVIALVSGLTLPPLALAFAWLLALNIARLIARTTRPAARGANRSSRGRSQTAAHAGPEDQREPAVEGAASRASSGKLAA